MIGRHHRIPQAKQGHDEAVLGPVEVHHVVVPAQQGVRGAGELQQHGAQVLVRHGGQRQHAHAVHHLRGADEAAAVHRHAVPGGRLPARDRLDHALGAAL